MLLLCITYIHKLPCSCSVFMCFVFTYSWLMKDTCIVHLNKRWFIHCRCHLELVVLQQLKLLQALGMVRRPQIVCVFQFTWQDKGTMLFALHWPDFGLSKPLSFSKQNSFVVLHTCPLYMVTAGCHTRRDITTAFAIWSSVEHCINKS